MSRTAAVATGETAVATAAGNIGERGLAGIRFLRRPALASIAALLLAFGGCTKSDVSAPSPPSEPILSGIIAGFPAVTADSGTPTGAVNVVGSSGLQRRGGGNDPFTPPIIGQTAVSYRITLQQLDAPYLAQSLILVDQNTGQPLFYYSVATGVERTNLTPLTTLLVAQLFASDVSVYFPSAGPSNIPGAATINAATIAEAQRRVTSYLENVVGIAVRSGTASFTSAPFNAAVGDPMYDTILALNARLVDNGSDLASLSTQIASAAVFCQLERLQVALGNSGSDEICPATKGAALDADDPTISVYSFTTPTGGALTVNARDRAVLGVEYISGNGSAFRCDGATCASVSLDAAATNGTRRITFNGAVLAGDDGSVTLDGALVSAYAGTTYAVPPCLDNKFFIVRPDNTVDAQCVNSAQFRIGTRGLIRQFYSFTNFNAAVPQTLEVVADDQNIYSTVVAGLDPDTGAFRADFLCRGADCSNVIVGPSESGGVRRVTVDAARIAATDGSGEVLIDATFSVTRPVQDFTPVDCSTATANIVAVTLSDETPAITVCPFPPDIGFGTSPSTIVNNDAGDLSYVLADVYTTPDGATTGAETIQVDTLGGALGRARFSRRDGETFTCTDPNCTGLVLGAIAPDGSRLVSFSNVQMIEQESYELVGFRTATLNGSFVAPPPPPP